MNHPVLFPYCFDESMPFVLRRIHPYKQEEVCKIYNYLKDIKGIKRVYIW